jgi:multisubunit Na+/H+ antiporter MnhE subunit
MSHTGKSSSVGDWLRRAVGLAVFVGRFFYELVLANIVIAKAVLFQKTTDLAPGFLSYPLTGLTRFEVLVLTHIITLTPGTASVMIAEDFSELTVHAFDVRDPEAVIASIKNGLEKPLLAWTR